MSQYTTKTREGQLNLLGLFHTILGVLVGLLSCLPLIHVAAGAMFLFAPGMLGEDEANAPIVAGAVGGLFMGLGLLFCTLGWTLAVCILLAGKYLKQRRKRTFCMVIGGIECLIQPLGTVLGVFTLIWLCKDDVQALYNGAEAD